MIERIFAAVLVCSCSTSGAAVGGGAKRAARVLAVDHVDDLFPMGPASHPVEESD